MDIEYIDLMLLHHPGTGDVEAYLAMEKAVAEGKIHSIGLSNWYIEELEELNSSMNKRFSMRLIFIFNYIAFLPQIIININEFHTISTPNLPIKRPKRL